MFIPNRHHPVYLIMRFLFKAAENRAKDYNFSYANEVYVIIPGTVIICLTFLWRVKVYPHSSISAVMMMKFVTLISNHLSGSTCY